MNGHTDVIVIGGGAAGMTAAIMAAEKEKNVVLLEKANRTGRKILASGNGRCNLMNNGVNRYYGDAEFADRVLQRCSRQDITSFFNRYGLILREESEGRVYPITLQSASVVSALRNAMLINSVNAIMDCQVISTEKHNNLFNVMTDKGINYETEKLIIACGGAAQPRLGGSTDGYKILKHMGHTLIPVYPSLVPLATDQKSISGLSGIRTRCRVNLIHDHQTVHSEEGEVLFTDYGVSGICIMQCARFVSISGSYLELDLLKDAFSDRKVVSQELRRRRQMFSSCSPVWLLNGIMQEKLSFAVLKQAGLALRGESAGEISDDCLEKIIDTACRYRINIIEKRSFDQAQVSAGGINCAEFDPMTMESTIVQGLYAAGEVLNVDGDCGGFNLMFAFASGIIAGMSV